MGGKWVNSAASTHHSSLSVTHIEPETHHSIGSSGLPLVTLLWAEIKWTWHEFLPPSHEAHCTLAESPWLALGDWQGAGINVTAR